MSGQRKALIVANDEYEQEGLRNLLAPKADAEALGRVLGDPQIGDFTVQVVRNQPAHVISAQIEEVFTESHPDDVLLLHFSGHGLKSQSGELFFAASNTRLNRLGSSAVSADFVQRCMRASRSRSVVLLLDCCYGGAFAQGVTVRAAGDVNVLDSFPHERTGGGRGRAVITASNAMEFAFEGNELGDNQHRRPSVFTSALVKGLATGEADRDEDGWISLNDLYDYVFDKVREQNPHQTPSRQVELQGELYLARSRRRRIRPAPLPPDLQAALADPNMYARLGAVSELRSRLASNNLPAAVGAYEALADLAHNDIQTVADPATVTLEGAALHPEETELHFGRVEQGSAPPHHTIRLLGLPIARAYVPHPSDDWIRADQTDDGLGISVDTTYTGNLHGTVDLKGPTGEATITIDIDLVSPTPRPEQEAAERARQEQEAAERARQEQEAAERARQEQEAAERARQEQEAAERARQEQEAAERARQEQEAAERARQEQEAAERARQEQEAAERARQEQEEEKKEKEEEKEEEKKKKIEALQRKQITTIHGPQSSQQTTHPGDTPAARSPIRRSAAFTGAGLAFLAGIAGFISTVLYHFQGASNFFIQAINLILIIVAIAVLLLPKNRLVIIGLLIGILSLSVANLAFSIVWASVDHALSYASHAAYFIEITGEVLGVIAAILLIASWSLAADRRRVPVLRALSVALLCSIALSLIADFIFYVPLNPHAYGYTVEIAGIVVVLAVTWYALTLRAHLLGGALVLGWATVWALSMFSNMFPWSSISATGRVASVVECVLLAIVVILAIMYMRRPSHPGSRAQHLVARDAESDG